MTTISKIFLIICLFFIILNIWRYQQEELKIKNSELLKLNNSEQEIALTGIIINEPEIKRTTQKIILKIDSIQNKKEKILITTKRYFEYHYGDKLNVIGKLKNPGENINGFNYKNYLIKDGICCLMNYPKIELLDKNFGNPIYKIIFSFKNRFKQGVEKFISPPQIGILEALVFGDETQFSKEWKEKLNLTGTRHITAVSGMNITILNFLILNLFLFFGFWRKQAIIISLFLIVLYILMIGAPASAIRAGIMGSMVLFAQYFGRLSSGIRLVIFSVCFMTFQNPLILKYDIGFQLSFLAILGLIYLQPFFFEKMNKIPDYKFFPIRTTLSATIAAQIFTLPILIFNFGYISLVSLFTNVLIVPFLAPITILIFIFGLISMFSILGPLAYILSLLVWFWLTYIVCIINLFSIFPFTSLTLENVHWAWLIISYLILGIIIFVINYYRTRIFRL